MIYDETNIVSEHDDCDECNAICYKLLDCDTYMTVSINDPAFSVYLGKTVKWVDADLTPENQVERCAIVDNYTCRDETLPEPNIEVIDAFNSCEDCTFVVPVPPIVIKTGRPVKPGYDVPECTN